MGLTDRKEAKDTKQLTFGKDWIEVRTLRLYGDTVAAQRAAASGLTPVEDKDGKGAAAQRIDFDISAFNLALVTSMTVAWSDNVPITEENYKKVPADIVNVVLEEMSGGEDLTKDDIENLEKASSSVSANQEEPSS